MHHPDVIFLQQKLTGPASCRRDMCVQVTPTITAVTHIQKDVLGRPLVNVNIPPPRKPGADAAEVPDHASKQP